MSNEIGTLIVVVLKARNLHDKHSFYKQDVYAQVVLNGVTKKTPVDARGGQHPVWDTELRFPITQQTADKHKTLEVSCWEPDRKTDENLGTGKVDITETLRTGEFDDWVKLDINGVYRGEVYLEMTYYANAPVPAAGLKGTSLSPNVGLTRRPSKLPASDRLSRPAAAHLPAARPNPNTNSNTHLSLPSTSPASSRSSSSSPRGRESPLPPLPEELPVKHLPLPNTLIPGGPNRPRPQSTPKPVPAPHLHPTPSPSQPPIGLQPHTQPQPQNIPSMLRPGNANATLGQSSPQVLNRPLSTSPPSGRGYSPPSGHAYSTPSSHGYTVDDRYTHTQPYTQQTQPQAPPVSVYSPPPVAATTVPPLAVYSPPPAAPDLWRNSAPASDPNSNPLTFSFPVPTVPAAQVPRDYNNGTSNSYYGGVTRPPPPSSYSPYPARSRNSTTESNRSDDLPDPYLIARYHTPLPLPPGSQVQPVQAVQSSPPRGRQSLEISPEDAQLRQKEARVLEEATARKEQEKRDMELARQLDRELNLGDLESG